jgi:hypothetical protein
VLLGASEIFCSTKESSFSPLALGSLFSGVLLKVELLELLLLLLLLLLRDEDLELLLLEVVQSATSGVDGLKSSFPLVTRSVVASGLNRTE